MKHKLDGIKAIEYESCLCTSDNTPVHIPQIKKYMLYNTAVINDQDAAAVLEQGLQETDARVVDLWPQQAAALFPDLLRQDVPPAEQKSETTTRPSRPQKICPSCGAVIQDSACPGPYEGERDGYGWIVSQFDCPHCGDHLGVYYDEDNGDCFDHIRAI